MKRTPTKELNNQIKELYNAVIIISYEIKEEERTKYCITFYDIYRQDTGLERITHKNLLRLLVINNKYNFYPHNWFGTKINYGKL